MRTRAASPRGGQNERRDRTAENLEGVVTCIGLDLNLTTMIASRAAGQDNDPGSVGVAERHGTDVGGPHPSPSLDQRRRKNARPALHERADVTEQAELGRFKEFARARIDLKKPRAEVVKWLSS